jgi:hypothetical protein
VLVWGPEILGGKAAQLCWLRTLCSHALGCWVAARSLCRSLLMHLFSGAGAMSRTIAPRGCRFRWTCRASALPRCAPIALPTRQPRIAQQHLPHASRRQHATKGCTETRPATRLRPQAGPASPPRRPPPRGKAAQRPPPAPVKRRSPPPPSPDPNLVFINWRLGPPLQPVTMDCAQRVVLNWPAADFHGVYVDSRGEWPAAQQAVGVWLLPGCHGNGRRRLALRLSEAAARAAPPCLRNKGCCRRGSGALRQHHPSPALPLQPTAPFPPRLAGS